MEPGSFSARQQKLQDALAFMEDALQLLDEAECSADVGAHLDLAICRLKDMLPRSRSAAVRSEAEPPSKCAE